jgi:hypothetical protein
MTDMGLIPYCTMCTSVPIAQCSRRYLRCCVVAPVGILTLHFCVAILHVRDLCCEL